MGEKKQIETKDREVKNIIKLQDCLDFLAYEALGLADIAETFSEVDDERCHGLDLLARLIRQHAEKLSQLQIKEEIEIVPEKSAPSTAAPGMGLSDQESEV